MKLKPVFYVEDDENDAYLMQHAFDQLGIPNPLVVACDGLEAINYLMAIDQDLRGHRDRVPAIILLDLNLPRKTGHEVLRWIRCSQSLRSAIVVILTSSSHDGDIQKAYQLGANAYVVKPPAFDQLLETTRTIKEFWLQQNRCPPDQPEARVLT